MTLFFGAALIAFITPYLLYPDPYAVILQLGNYSAGKLFLHLLRRTAPIWAGSLMLIAVISFGDLSGPFDQLATKAFYFIYGVTFFSSLFLFSICRYSRSGLRSQYWKESEKGRDVRRKMGEYFKYPLDQGSIPSFINTVLVGTVGMLGVPAGAALYGAFGLGYELLPGLFLLLLAVLSVKKLWKHFVQNYYATHAFFSEFFGETAADRDESSEVQPNQLWWAPDSLRPHVWALLLQLDRKFPLGRVLAVGHILIWLLSYRDPGDRLMISAWLFFALFHHVAIVMSTADEFAPVWFSKWIGSPANWVMVRVWIQLRWILILGASILFNSLIFGHVSFTAQAFILLFYIGSAGLISFLIHMYQHTIS